ncbi:unhealthy ribosome biogenesis protein 2 homolog isoform X1 [Calypte anna]|uniref:unhealthy ribosome biogenesis protein 2 homolog isoform X1 n=1 Tax=Calypte anna TaxID=9244 RepID=UPI0011C3DD08|nr:unhealthy ribosome biogenesis protein 2 homolog isoform X1 [Calypte anna]XP_030304286.1 unhealthy ribosome biogenesis protein 2 homolog isoform X1 [Calypte anna]XP_030304287.1 unhealthy ribosome biogenesis protein 2 homolog isoform X1 [Calypte anna]XP_030304288.1 unhealthy ribosome biogenesis protein 2 homolog isoform X1 [Calypte anna]
MAAVYSGIYLKLKSGKTSWEDKLKLAHFAWISHQCVLPNKEQVLLDWVSHTLVSYYNKKLELEDEVVEKLWAYLDNIIHSRRLQTLLKSGKTVGLSFSIAQVINKRLSEACVPKLQQNIGTVLSCSSGILSTPSLSIIYTAKCELLVDLLSQLSKLACQQLAPEDAVGPQLFSVLQLTFAQYLLLQRQQTNPNRVFGQVTSHLLQPCLFLRHLLAVRNWTQGDDSRVRQHLSREIRNQVETLLRAGLFQPELFSSYKEELLPEQELQEKKKGALKSLLLPVNTVLTKLGSDFCQPALHGAVVAGSVSLLYKLFLDSYCKAENHLVCFHMLSRLFGCLRLSGLQQGVMEDMLSPADWSAELLALEQLLSLVLSNDVYNVASDRIRHKEIQFGFYRQLAQVLLSHSQASIPAWFRCLKLLMSLNHLIVEPDLDDLVASAWIDADVSEPRTKKPQEALISSMFQTYSKLRQFPRLFEEVLTVICQPAADEMRLPVFSAALTLKLRECLLELPPSQILDILCLFVEKCQTLIIPAVEGSDDMALKLLSLSLVLHAFLFNMRSLDDVTPSPVILRTQSLLAKMQKGIIQPLMELLQAPRREEEKSELWLRKASDSAFLLVYTWIEVDTLFGVSCSKYVSPAAEVAGVVTASAARHSGTSVFLPGVEEQCWERVMELANSFATSKYCLELLTLQNMKTILMQTEADLKTLQHAAAFILESGRSIMSRRESEPWDGDISAINDLTYPTAHWHLVISNLTILLPYISLKDVEYIADILLETLVLGQAQEAVADQEPSISIEKVSLSFIKSSFFPEMKVLHCAFLTSLIHQVAGVLPSAAKDAADLPLQQLSADRIPWHEEILAPCRPVNPLEAPSESKLLKDELSLSWKTLERVAQCVVLLAKSGCPVILKEHQLERCLGLLEIVSFLKLDSLLPSDSTRCFLVLLSLISNTRAGASCSKLLLLKFLSTCFHLLRCLQAGRNANSIFKVFHASDVLETVMGSQLTASKVFTDVLTVPVWAQYLQEVQAFLENFLQMIIERRQSVRLNLEKIMSFLMSCKADGAAKSKGCKNYNPAAGQLLLMAFTTLCHVVTLYLQQLPEKKLQSADVLAALLEPVVLQMVRTVEHGLQNNTQTQPLPLTFIPSVTTLLKADLSHAVKKGWQKEPGGFLDQPRVKLYQKFYSQILRELPCAGDNLRFLQSALQFLVVFCSVPELYPGKETAVTVVFAIRKLLAGPAVTTQVIQSMEVELTEVLVQLLGNCSAEEFYTIMKLVLQGLEVKNVWQQNAKEVLSAVTLTKLLLSCPLSGDKEKAFWFASPQIITALAMQTKEACQDQSLISTIVVPILETVAALLRQGEGVLLNPHHVALAFSILLTVPLDHLKTEDYQGVFLGVHEVLFSIVQCHPKVLLKAAPSFLNSFHRLVVSVMHEGRQKGDGGSTEELEVPLRCAHLVERMYTHIAAEMEDFTVFSAFIVAQYVTELQKVTLHPAVKNHLTEGIYHILALCIERDIKFLNVSLPAGVREVFKDLYEDYKRYHKAKKQGEEKYTA